jgi:hypothetical protein
MLSDTTQSDLEYLLAEVDRGWCAYRSFTSGAVAASFGMGGCLVEEMSRMLLNQPIELGMPWPYENNKRRQDAMVEALGFSDYEVMFAWNDAQRDPDVIKRRIKDALNGEYAHAQ